MENLLLSFNVVAPLVIYMAVGWILRATGTVDERTFSKISRMTFYTAIPALCLDNLRTLDFAAIFATPYALYMGAGVIVVFLAAFLLVPRFSKENARRGVIVMGIFRSNDGVFGLAVASALFGPDNIALMVVCVAITIPLFNLFAVTEMEYFRGGKMDVGSILLKLLKNPIIVGCLVGAALSLLKVDLPTFLAKPLSGISAMCAPLGFIALGGELSLAGLYENRKALTAVSLLRLVVIPAVVLAVFYFMKFSGDALLVALIIFGAPAAMSVYPMACGMDGDEKLAAGIVASTSVLSLITIFLFIFVLKQFGVA